MKNKVYWILALLTVVGGVLRFFQLGDFPISLNWDEVSHGYNAFSILKTGKDEWGKSFPLIFRAFGDYKLPVYIYLTTIPVWLFGLTPFAVRFISALAGTLAIPGIFLLTRELFPQLPSVISTKRSPAFSPGLDPGEWRNLTLPDWFSNLHKETPLISAFILTFLPWHFFISRPALEANLSLTLIIFGFYYLIRYFRHCAHTHLLRESNTDSSLRVSVPRTEAIPASEGSQSVSLLPAAILLGLSLHTYNTARIFVPLLVLVSIFIYFPLLRISSILELKQSPLARKIKNIFAVLVFLFLSGLVLYQVILGEGTARYEKLKILSPSAVFQIGENRAQSDLPPVIARAIHNRPVFFATSFFKNYLGYFSPDFFYQKWGAQFQFAIPEKNLLTLPIFLLAFLGFFSFIQQIRPSPNKERKDDHKPFLFIFSWLLLSPVAASLTADPPQALRPNPMIPALAVLAALGLRRLIQIIPENRRLRLIGGIGVWMIVIFGLYVQTYASEYKEKYSSSWQYGYEQVMAYVQEHKDEYDRVLITKRYGEPHIFYAFYTELPPEKIQPSGDNLRFQKSEWYWTDKIENVYFINDWQIPTVEVKSLPLESGGEVSAENSLLITSPDHVPVSAVVKETVKFLDGSPAFIITAIP